MMRAAFQRKLDGLCEKKGVCQLTPVIPLTKIRGKRAATCWPSARKSLMRSDTPACGPVHLHMTITGKMPFEMLNSVGV